MCIEFIQSCNAYEWSKIIHKANNPQRSSIWNVWIKNNTALSSWCVFNALAENKHLDNRLFKYMNNKTIEYTINRILGINKNKIIYDHFSRIKIESISYGKSY